MPSADDARREAAPQDDLLFGVQHLFLLADIDTQAGFALPFHHILDGALRRKLLAQIGGL